MNYLCIYYIVIFKQLKRIDDCKKLYEQMINNIQPIQIVYIQYML